MNSQVKNNFIQLSFELNIAVMKLLGFYPSDERSQVTKVGQYCVFFLFPFLFTFLGFMLIFTQENTNIIETNYVVIFIIESSLVTIKAFVFLLNSDYIKKCLNYFVDAKFSPKDVKEEELIEECVNSCRRNSKIYIRVIIVVILIWMTPQIITFNLPVEVWLPYDPKSAPTVFYCTTLYIFMAAVYDACTDSVLPLIGGLADHAKTQVKILKYNLENLDKYVMYSQNTVTFCSLSKYLKHCIDRHNSILNFVAEYENCFSLAMFFQFAGTMFTVCFCCIGLILGNTASFDSFRNGAILLIANFQLLFFCYYGTLLFEENDTLIDAIYMGPWYNYDVRIRKHLVMMMERSKRPMIITAGKIVDVTLQTFASVLKSSYSLIAVFNRY